MARRGVYRDRWSPNRCRRCPRKDRTTMVMFRSTLSAAVVISVLLLPPAALAQVSKGAIEGTAKDAVGGPLQGARIELQPVSKTGATDEQGRIRHTDVVPGRYT